MEEKRIITDEQTGSQRELAVHNGGVSAEQVENWKREYRKLYAIEVEDEGDLFIGYFRRPTMETMSAVSRVSKTDEVKGAATLFDNCYLGGDPTMKSDAIVRMAAIKQLGNLFDHVVGSLKNV